MPDPLGARTRAVCGRGRVAGAAGFAGACPNFGDLRRIGKPEIRRLGRSSKAIRQVLSKDEDSKQGVQNHVKAETNANRKLDKQKPKLIKLRQCRQEAGKSTSTTRM